MFEALCLTSEQRLVRDLSEISSGGGGGGNRGRVTTF